MAKGLIKSIGTDGKEVLSNILSAADGNALTYKEVTEYCDGTVMDDSKVDGKLYIKREGSYYLRSFDSEKSRTLSLNSVDELRNLSIQDIILIRLGYYRKIETKGYYEDGDGGGIDYVVKNGSAVDDGYLVIRTALDSDIYFTPNLKTVTFPKLAGAKGIGASFDDAPALNLFFTKSATLPDDKIIIDWEGTWYIKDTIHLQGLNKIFNSGKVFYTGSAMLPEMIKIDTETCTHTGFIYARSRVASTTIPYANRDVENIVTLGIISGTKFDGFIIEGAKRYGIRNASGGSNFARMMSSNLGLVRVFNCGSCGDRSGGLWNRRFNYSNPVREGGQNVITQTVKLDVEDFDEFIQVDDTIRIESDPYRIMSIDRVNNTINIFPWLRAGTPTGGVAYSNHGGGVEINSTESAQLVIEGIFAMRVGVALYLNTLYGPTLKTMITQVGGVSIAQRGLNYGFTVNSFHSETPEGSGFDFLKMDQLECRTLISGISVLRFNDWHRLVPKNNAGNDIFSLGPGIYGVMAMTGGAVYNHQNRESSISNNPRNNNYSVRGNTSINLSFNRKLRDLWNYTDARIIWQHEMSDTMTINCTDDNTIEGQASLVIPGQGGIIEILMRFDVTVNDWKVYFNASNIVRRKPSNVVEIGSDATRTLETAGIIKSKSATLTTPTDIEAIANAQTTIGNVTLTDAALGDIVNVNQMNIAGLHIKGVVTAANTIALSAINVTSSDITIPEGTIFKTIILK